MTKKISTASVVSPSAGPGLTLGSASLSLAHFPLVPILILQLKAQRFWLPTPSKRYKYRNIYNNMINCITLRVALTSDNNKHNPVIHK